MSMRISAPPKRHRLLAIAFATVALVAAATANAQSNADVGRAGARWQAFVGCWRSVTPNPSAGAGANSRVCVIPSAGNSAVEIVAVDGDRVVSRARVDATGATHEVSRDGCSGSESAEASADGHRIYVYEHLNCDGTHRVSTSVFAMSPQGEWLDVRLINAGPGSGVQASRYREITDLQGMSREIVAALREGQLARSTARMAASAPLTRDAIVDMTRHVDAKVVETLLLERGTGFALNARELAALADAGVPGRVTDMMVALTYPKVFAINPAARSVSPVERSGGELAEARPRASESDLYAGGFSPFGWSTYDPFYGYGYSPYGSRGYNNGYGYGYGNGYNGWYPGTSPVVIVVRGSDADPSHARLVKGRGYTEGRSSGATTSSSGSFGSSSAGSSGSKPSTSSGSSSSGSSSGSSSSGRTAHRRP